MLLNADNKIISPDANCAEIIAHITPLPQPLVFTNGCFDILHRGHVSYLEEARNLGAALVVGVNSDESVRQQNKGTDRPFNTLADRMAVLASLACVDAVVSFAQATPYQLIELVNPQHLVKGGDWAVEAIVGADLVAANGGQVHSLAFKFDRSTTMLVKKIRS